MEDSRLHSQVTVKEAGTGKGNQRQPEIKINKWKSYKKTSGWSHESNHQFLYRVTGSVNMQGNNETCINLLVNFKAKLDAAIFNKKRQQKLIAISSAKLCLYGLKCPLSCINDISTLGWLTGSTVSQSATSCAFPCAQSCDGLFWAWAEALFHFCLWIFEEFPTLKIQLLSRVPAAPVLVLVLY